LFTNSCAYLFVIQFPLLFVQAKLTCPKIHTNSLIILLMYSNADW